MENLSHSLVGAALAELSLPRDATATLRRVFFTVGVIGANLPDADLLYTRITPPPLGYMLHHRGHTHTIVGAAALAALLGLFAFVPGIRGVVARSRGRFWLLAALALASHLVLDAWNSYGVHPFFPLNNRWYYGDAVYILDPWLWVMLGVAATVNTRATIARFLLGAVLVALPVAAVALHMMPPFALAPLSVIAIALLALGRRRAPRWRSGTALAATAVYVSLLFGVSALVRTAVRGHPPAGARGDLLDVVLRPSLGDPLCWEAITVEVSERDDRYSLRRAAISLAPEALRVGECVADRRAAGATSSIPVIRWTAELPQSLSRLRGLYRDNCAVRAWMQFGRVPVLGDHDIADFRFGGPGQGNFTAMSLESGPACPPNLTRWTPPRADLLGAASP